MLIAISAPPHIDPAPKAAELARGQGLPVETDPTPALVRAYGFQTLYDMPAALQRETRLRLVREHAARVGGGSGAVLDHAVFGWLADWMRWFWQGMPAEAWDAVIAEARAAVQGYDAIVHLADGASRAYDGYWWLDPRNGRQIEPLLRHLYGELGVAEKVRS